MLADENGREFKMNEFAYIIFSRRNGEPCEHGRSEKAAWTAMVQKRHSHRNLHTEKEFFEIEVRLKQIDHVAVSCGDHGHFIWVERMPLDNALKLTS